MVFIAANHLLGMWYHFWIGFDLALRDVHPCRSFDAEYVEVDCVFVKD
jgi:hypothetical protein